MKHLQRQTRLEYAWQVISRWLLNFSWYNEYLGWAHTVNSRDKIDVYQLEMNHQ